ncbi:MarR family transcriptional regulator [Sphingomonas donggukensis]|uniref:MarR family transcriptional regulator n=1 Tax=Sphingomonas donggukensis TaxID=2949093 RepID=A0ABY4TW56_9SPHN|nr:MarR family transcriptional regulator [Sphingomonas donggukensis]URW75946.1 MarR family transcriptional regulator [Sphingomonas donggukensis]
MNDTSTSLDDAAGHRLRLAAARASQQIGVVLAPHALTPIAWTALRQLHDSGPVAPSVLADACGLTRGAVTKLVDRLRERRFVVRAAAGRDDRRYQTVALTGAGATLVRELAPLVAACDRHAASDGAG